MRASGMCRTEDSTLETQERLQAPLLLVMCMSATACLGSSAPGMVEEAPRNEAAWPGIQATTVTKAMPAHHSIAVGILELGR